MKIKWSIDDGAQEDLGILAPLFKKYNQKCIFYINSGLIHDTIRRDHARSGKLMLKNEVVKLAKEFEIGGHTVNHPMELGKMIKEDQEREIVLDKKALQELTGQSINSFCHPRGRYNEGVIEILKANNYKEARTTVVGFGSIDDNPYRLKCFHLAQRKEYEGKPWLEYIKDKFIEGIKNNEKEMRIWGHWFELRCDNGLNKLDQLLKFITCTENKKRN